MHYLCNNGFLRWAWIFRFPSYHISHVVSGPLLSDVALAWHSWDVEFHYQSTSIGVIEHMLHFLHIMDTSTIEQCVL